MSGYDDHMAEGLQLSNISKELSELKAKIPKLKADAVREFASEHSYCDFDCDASLTAFAEIHANKLEAGE